MYRLLALLALCLVPACAQTAGWTATTGDVLLSGSGTAATIQQPASGASTLIFDKAIVYCSVACSVTQAANGTAATTTAGTVNPLLPTNNLGATAPFNFYTASNVGTGVAQGGITHVPAGGTAIICLNAACGNPQTVTLAGAGTNVNYTMSVASITGTANITFYVETK